jgi:hypothetical protein
LNNRIKSFDNRNEFGIEPTKFNIKKCIKYIAHAWDGVTPVTIQNCWLKTGILPKNDEDNIEDNEDINIPLHFAHTREMEDIQELIDKLNIKNPLSAEEYVHYNNSKGTIKTTLLTDEEILKAVFPND